MTATAMNDIADTNDEQRHSKGPRWSWTLRIGVGIVVAFIVMAITAPLLATHNPHLSDVLNKLQPPSRDHWLGTDALGRDVYSRIVHAARLDLSIAFAAATISAVIGITLGSLAGFTGRWVDTIVMRTADVIQAFPVYVLLIALIFALGEGIRAILVAFAIVAWVPYARLVRGEIRRVRDLDYVHAATLGGLGYRRVLIGHVLPNTIKQPLVYYTFDVVGAVVALSAVAYLGLGIPPDTVEWGLMIADGQLYLREQWWLAVAPGVVIALFGLGLTLVADGIDARWRER